MAEIGKLSGMGAAPQYALHGDLAPNDNATVPTTKAVQDAINLQNALSEMGDAAITSPVTGDMLHYTAGKWTNATKAALLSGASINLTSGVLQLQEAAVAPVNAVAASKVMTLAGGVPTDTQTVTIGASVYRWRDAIGAAVAASKVLNVTGVPTALHGVTIGTTVYRWRNVISAAVAASRVLTLTGNLVNTKIVTIGTGGTAKIYTSVTALTEAKATSILTLSDPPTDGNSITIGTTKYTFREALTAPAVAYEVLIEATASDTIDNIIVAIMGGLGGGTKYSTGTLEHPSVTAAVGALDTMGITAKVPGVAGNSIATTELSAVCSWTAGTMGSGVDPVANEVAVALTDELSIDSLVAAINGAAGAGTLYATGTTAHTTVTAAKTAADKMTATAVTAGFAGNLIATTTDQTNATWAGVVMAGGEDAQAAYDVLLGISAEVCIDNLVLAVAGTTGAGTNFGTGTATHTTATAVKASAAEMTITARTAGTGGNAIAIAEDDANTNFVGAAVFLSGGVAASIAGDVLIGTAEQCIDNLVLAVAGTAGAGTNFGTGTAPNISCTAAKTAADTMLASALVKGIVGNAIVIGETSSNLSWAGAAVLLSGGVDGTVGVANQTSADASYIYHCIAANTIADANWRRIALGTAY